MGLARFVGRLLAQIAEVPALARPETVARLVPATADYVTVGPAVILTDAQAFNGGPLGRGAFGRDLGYSPDRAGERREVGLLVLAEGRLRVISERGERWSADVRAVTGLDAHRRSGFLVFLHDGTGLAVGTQTPVQVPHGSTFRTTSGMTNSLSGWDEALAPFGVSVHW